MNRTYYLRNKNNKNIADIEVNDDDISCVIDIANYSLLLMSLDSYSQGMLIKHVNDLNEIRGEYFERNYANKSTHELVKEKIEYIANIFNLKTSSD